MDFDKQSVLNIAGYLFTLPGDKKAHDLAKEASLQGIQFLLQFKKRVDDI